MKKQQFKLTTVPTCFLTCTCPVQLFITTFQSKKLDRDIQQKFLLLHVYMKENKLQLFFSLETVLVQKLALTTGFLASAREKYKSLREHKRKRARITNKMVTCKISNRKKKILTVTQCSSLSFHFILGRLFDRHKHLQRKQILCSVTVIFKIINPLIESDKTIQDIFYSVNR